MTVERLSKDAIEALVAIYWRFATRTVRDQGGEELVEHGLAVVVGRTGKLKLTEAGRAAADRLMGI